MAARLDVVQDWADGTYRFKLAIGQLEEHDEKCGAGPLVVLERLLSGTWHVRDIRETIRLGLIGGGTRPAEAMTLIRRYVDEQPLRDSVAIATVILSVVVMGRDEADTATPGKPEAATSASDPAGSTSPPSDATPSSSASAPPS